MARRLKAWQTPIIKCGVLTHRSNFTRRCTMPAGWHTATHSGFGPCVSHETRESRRAWTLASDIARELDVTPWDALLLGCRLAAGRVAWVDRQLTNAVDRNDGDMSALEIRIWLVESRRERTLLARVSKAAIDAGVAERVVRQLELESQVLVAAIERAIDVLDLTPDQRIAALSAAQDQLFSIEQAS